MGKPQKGTPAYMKEVREIRRLMRGGATKSFSQIHRELEGDRYERFNRRQARISRALTFLVREGELERRETSEKSGRVEYCVVEGAED